MIRPSRKLVALGVLLAAVSLTAACAAILGVDDVGYAGADASGGDGSGDGTTGPADGALPEAASSADGAIDAGDAACGENTKVCVVCVAAQSPATGCDPHSCSPCAIGPHADAGCTGTKCSVASCESPFLDCDNNPANGCEVNSQSGDPQNCGACGAKCVLGLLCQPDGGCASGCGSTNASCGGGCVDTTSNVQNCGGCGKVCPGNKANNTVVTCTNGMCGFTCTGQTVDCNKDASDGCECDTASAVCMMDGTCASCTPLNGTGCTDTAAGCCPQGSVQPTCSGAGATSVCCQRTAAACVTGAECCSHTCAAGGCL